VNRTYIGLCTDAYLIKCVRAIRVLCYGQNEAADLRCLRVMVAYMTPNCKLEGCYLSGSVKAAN
jgi:hypothetical protein